MERDQFSHINSRFTNRGHPNGRVVDALLLAVNLCPKLLSRVVEGTIYVCEN